MIIRSDKPNAKKFRKWITSEVLPAIRKTGGYTYEQSNICYPRTHRLGEVVELTKTAIKLMERQNRRPFEITSVAVEIFRKFGIDMPNGMLPTKYILLNDGSVKNFLQKYGEVLHEPVCNVYANYVEFCNQNGYTPLNREEAEAQIKGYFGATVEIKRIDSGRRWVYVY